MYHQHLRGAETRRRRSHRDHPQVSWADIASGSTTGNCTDTTSTLPTAGETVSLAPSTVLALRVPGVRCEGCLHTIREALGELPSVSWIAGDPQTKTVTVDYDPRRVSPAEIASLLGRTGFPTDPIDASTPGLAGRRVLLLAAGGAMFLALVGHILGFQAFIYGLMLPKAFDRLGTVTVGMVAGTAAFFSPCVFPLLPGYVSYCLTRDGAEPGAGRPLGAAVRAGGAAALGVMTVNTVILGIIAVAGAASPFEGDIRDESPGVLAVRFCAGAMVAALGVRALLGGRGSGRLSQLGGRVPRPSGFFVYGMTYNAAGLGCTGPILLGLMLYYALISQQALVAFTSFTLTMGLLMIAVTVAAASARQRLLGRLRRGMTSAQQAAGAVMVGLGVFTMASQSFPWGRDLFVRVFTRYVL